MKQWLFPLLLEKLSFAFQRQLAGEKLADVGKTASQGQQNTTFLPVSSNCRSGFILKVPQEKGLSIFCHVYADGDIEILIAVFGYSLACLLLFANSRNIPIFTKLKRPNYEIHT